MGEDRDAQADALMGALRREGTGRLTVFLGPAPGVGKTYAMLQRARELQRQGVDVVVGVVETHGRSETHALLQGLAVVPLQRVEYRGRRLEEMDLDALLKRRPQVALVDELAHRNVPGSRHQRRWQDVMELLDAGVDVYTTVNIQHLESLNDVVHRITGVRVSETVPDAVFERLRDVRLVDLPPRELIERLHQGKVYLPEQAAQALQAFFSIGNLQALRELAMQTVAEHVDADLRESQAARGLAGPALRQHVMVAIDGRGSSEYLVRVGRRIAERRGAPWTVVSVETARSSAGAADAMRATGSAPGGTEQARLLELDKAFALARRLGGETATLHGDDVAGALLDEAAARGASALVLGRTRERPVARIFNRTITQQLLARGAQYELTIVSTPQAVARSGAWRRWRQRAGTGGELLVATLASAAAVATASLAERFLALTDLSMVFIVAVLLVAARTRMTASVVTALLCFLGYNFFFIEPRYTFYIGAFPGVATVFIFLVTALVAGRLASRLRSQVLALRAANSHATALQTLGRELASAADSGQVGKAASRVLQTVLGADVRIALGSPDTLGETLGDDLGDKDQAAALWCRRHGQPAGRYTDTLGQSSWWFLPVQAEGSAVGVVGLRFPDPVKSLGFEQHRLAEAMVEDIGQAVLRTRLVADLESARVNEETERLRSALLSSVSHDLRSPLASMIGAADSLAEYGTAVSAEDRASLLQTIRQEGHRLDRYIQNLLDMTRLGQHGLALTRDWIGVDELVGSATSRLQRYSPSVRFEIDIPSGLPPIEVHPALIEQALFNVLENAEKFSPPGEPIQVRVRREGERLRLDVSDRGPGIPPDERRRIFDMFYSVERGDRGRQGSGLGLAIVQGIVGAHMGSIEALAGPGGVGTTIRIGLPWSAPRDPGHTAEHEPA
ncbi:MAG: sensor histidine kinase KdpD [Piscinibacter sp.]|nr:sensor histidine kinase KdpD [Piscinibacter sp.]